MPLPHVSSLVGCAAAATAAAPRLTQQDIYTGTSGRFRGHRLAATMPAP